CPRGQETAVRRDPHPGDLRAPTRRTPDRRRATRDERPGHAGTSLGGAALAGVSRNHEAGRQRLQPVCLDDALLHAYSGSRNSGRYAAANSHGAIDAAVPRHRLSGAGGTVWACLLLARVSPRGRPLRRAEHSLAAHLSTGVALGYE